MKHIFAALLAAPLLAACASTTPYGPAAKDGAKGYTTQQIENDRFRVAYTDRKADTARDYALLRAAEVTLENGGDWFELTNGYTEGDTGRRGGIRPTIGVGGSVGSRGYHGGGVGIGIGLPVGGSSSGVTESLEFVIGKGAKPDKTAAYDARSVQASMRGMPQ
jgi:hypothetical protein